MNDLKVMLVNYQNLDNLIKCDENLAKIIIDIKIKYIEKFNNIDEYWKIKPNKLLDVLFSTNDKESLYFLYNNYDFKLKIAKFAIKYNELDFLKYCMVELENLEKLIKYSKKYKQHDILKFLEQKIYSIK